MSEHSIVLDQLSKKYGSSNILAVNKLSLNVDQGEVYGFLGPNGAGKSTTIRMLLNFIQPSSGNASILGGDIVKKSVILKKDVGYLSGEVQLYPKMTGKQFLDYMTQLQPLKNKTYLKYLIRIFKADINAKISDLSKGNKQKIGVIAAFAHQPKILILDEPTSGLDPLMQEEFFKLVGEHKANGASLFISSHNLSEVQKMCDRVGFIRSGKLVSEQDIAKAIADAARTFDITFEGKLPLAELRQIPGVKLSSGTRNGISVHIKGDLAPLFQVLARHKVSSINQREVNLEAEFLHFYESKEGKS